MGIFRQFPYTNFHDLNLDWILNKVKELSDEWLTYNDNWNKWINDTNTAFAELKDYVQNYFNDLNVDEEINKIFDDLIASGYFDAVIERLLLKKENTSANLVGSGFNDYIAGEGLNAFIQGSAYIGNGKYVAYFSNDTNDIGSLKTFDANTHSVINEQSLTLMHGNSLTYDPINNKIYACGCFSRADANVLVPDIFEIDASDITNFTIIRTITPPLPTYATGIYSLAFNITDRKFYAICARGTTAGEYNRVIVYNETLTEIIDEFVIADTQPQSSQGIQFAYNESLFIMYYASNYKCIYSININTKKIDNIYSIPQFINGYRNCGELQSIIHDYDKQNWYICSDYRASGWYHKVGYSISEVGLFKSIPVIVMTNGNINNSAKHNINIDVELGNYVPSSMTRMPSLMDAVMSSILSNTRASLFIKGSYRILGSCSIADFTGLIVGESSNRIEWKGDPTISNSNIRISYTDFNGSIINPPSFRTDTGNIAIYNSYIATPACTCDNKLLIMDSIYIGSNLKSHSIGSIFTGRTTPIAESVLETTALLPYYTA